MGARQDRRHRRANRYGALPGRCGERVARSRQEDQPRRRHPDHLYTDGSLSPYGKPGKAEENQDCESSADHGGVPHNLSQDFPLGFKDLKYIGERTWGERQFKWDAHLQWNETLSVAQGERLLAADNVEELVRRAQSVEARSNLLSVPEKNAFRESLAEQAAAQAFFRKLFDLLASAEISEEHFNSYVGILDSPHFLENGRNSATWPIATLFPFLAQPERFIFLKPEATKNCAEMLGFDLNYRPDLNWLTYKNLLEMCAILHERLAAFKPQDMIDIQSFIDVIWRLKEGTYEI